MKLPSWIKKPTAPIAELEEQVAAVKEAAATEPAKTLEAALAAFDESPTLENEQAVVVARQAATLAAERVARAERLLAQAQERDAEAKRQALLDERTRLEGELQKLDQDQSRHLVAEEAQAWLAVAAVRARRVENHQESKSRAVRLLAVRLQLGELDAQTHNQMIIAAIQTGHYSGRVAEEIRETAAGMAAGPLRDAAHAAAFACEGSDRYANAFRFVPRMPEAPSRELQVRINGRTTHRIIE